MALFYKYVHFQRVILNIVIIIIFVSNLQAQVVQINPTDEIFEDHVFAEKVKASEEKEKVHSIVYTKKQISLINEQINLRSEFLNDLLSSGELLLHSPLQKYVDSVFNIILKANPEISKDYQVFVSRSSIPNAFNIGGGFIIINAGLLERLENEAELAFVLSHELSHQVLDHVNQNIVEYVIADTDKARKEQIKKILQSKYRVYSQLENLILPGLTKEMSFRRSMELQADSLGLSYYLRTSLPAYGPLNTMTLLNIIDSDEDTSLIDFKSLFASDSIRFNPSWLKYGNVSSLSGVIQKPDTLADVLKSHPDALYRMDILRKLLQDKTADSPGIIQSDKEFEKMRLIARIENIHGMYLNGSYSRAIFAAIKTIEKYPEQNYPKQILSIMLGRLSLLKVAKKAGVFLEYNNKEYSEAFNRVISFLWETNSKDCAQLAYWMIRPAADESARYGLEALLYSAMAMDRKKEFRTLFSKYRKSYSNTSQTAEFSDYLEN